MSTCNSVKTPELAVASEALTRLIQEADNGGADLQQGKLVVSGSNAICRVIKTDLDRRLAGPKLIAAEARLIEAETRQQIERPTRSRAA